MFSLGFDKLEAASKKPEGLLRHASHFLAHSAWVVESFEGQWLLIQSLFCTVFTARKKEILTKMLQSKRKLRGELN